MVVTSLNNAIVTLITILHSLPHMSQTEVLATGLRVAPHGNLWLEFGVFRALTLQKIATTTNDTIYGFDSFEGLPETWRLSKNNPGNNFDRSYTMKGSFSLQGKLPSLHAPNTRLIKGWFNNTLPRFLQEHTHASVSMLHIDCDLYSSAAYVLTALKTRIRVGTVIVFDELINYPSFEKHEFLALFEWLKDTGHVLKVLSGANMIKHPRHEVWPQAVAFQVVDRKHAGAPYTFNVHSSF